MHRITPVLVFLLVLAACSSDDESADAPGASETTVTTAAAETSTTGPATADADETTTTADETSTSETTEGEPQEEPDDEVGLLCSSYLASITPPSFGEGLVDLAELLGDDAPPGVLDAIDTLQEPNDDIEAFFAAQNTIDGYVLPICRERFSSAIVPAADNATAADEFLAAVRSGDRSSAERLAPDNVIVLFDWDGYPDATGDFSPDNSTFSMLLEPTVTVFCQLDGGAVEFCAFGE